MKSLDISVYFLLEPIASSRFVLSIYLYPELLIIFCVEKEKKKTKTKHLKSLSVNLNGDRS